MVMDPRNHPRGAPPDFELPKPNPDPDHMTDALWWLVCMRMKLSEHSRNGGTYAYKAGSHNTGQNLLDHRDKNGRRVWADDHSIRHKWNRTGPWWRTKTAAHDWTFNDAHAGTAAGYRTISLFTGRMIRAMKDPNDLRPDRTVFYTIGNADGDAQVEAYHELNDADMPNSDKSHLWHRHDSFFRNIIGLPWEMWKVLTIDMGWTYAEWLQSTAAPKPPPKEVEMQLDDELWPKAKPPEWAAPYAALLDGGNPTVRNVLLHSLRHAATEARWTDRPWSTAEPASASDALQRAAKADDALREVQELRKVVDAQGALLAEILLRLPGGPAT
jgi:hypothetical protein